MLFRLLSPARQKGFSIIEAFIAILIITGGFLVVLSLVMASLRLSTQSRNRIYANIIAENMLEKFRAHRYGDPEPAFWTIAETSRITTEGIHRPLVTEFKKEIEYQNGSFVGRIPGNIDEITVTVSWVEGTNTGGSGVTKSLQIKTSVMKPGSDGNLVR